MEMFKRKRKIYKWFFLFDLRRSMKGVGEIKVVISIRTICHPSKVDFHNWVWQIFVLWISWPTANLTPIRLEHVKLWLKWWAPTNYSIFLGYLNLTYPSLWLICLVFRWDLSVNQGKTSCLLFKCLFLNWWL